MNTKRRTVQIPKTSLKVKRSKAGLGLFATTNITPGSYVEYIGNIISNEKANSMVGARYLFEINSRWTIDGSPRYNVARYVNHSCLPNCESVQTGKKVYIKAIKKIPAGEELTYDYGKEYFDEFIQSIGCICKKCTK
jgi:SET domain-containing protein